MPHTYDERSSSPGVYARWMYDRPSGTSESGSTLPGLYGTTAGSRISSRAATVVSGSRSAVVQPPAAASVVVTMISEARSVIASPVGSLEHHQTVDPGGAAGAPRDPDVADRK